MARRDAILKAVLEADRLHKEFDTKARALLGAGRIDVFGMLVSRDIPVMFRPLKSLLGAYIDDPDRGVIVTTQRPLPVQRFTAAHELGHAALGHEASLDEEDILTRALFVTEASYDPREIQANAFATQLLTPPWLLVQHMKRQGWTRESLADARIVYQLALRMGSSYAATCYALAESKGIVTGKAGRRQTGGEGVSLLSQEEVDHPAAPGVLRGGHPAPSAATVTRPVRAGVRVRQQRAFPRDRSFTQALPASPHAPAVGQHVLVGTARLLQGHCQDGQGLPAVFLADEAGQLRHQVIPPREPGRVDRVPGTPFVKDTSPPPFELVRPVPQAGGPLEVLPSDSRLLLPVEQLDPKLQLLQGLPDLRGELLRGQVVQSDPRGVP